MGSSAGAPPPDSDPAGYARKRLVAAIRQAVLSGTWHAETERRLERALDEWWEAKEREWTGEV